jgi:hypothetical protein
MSRPADNKAHERNLRDAPDIPSFLEALRNTMRNGTLGQHLQRLYAPCRDVVDAEPSLVSTITLAGVRDGMALIEFRSSNILSSGAGLSHFRTERQVKAGTLGKPWLRALVPLKGSLEGAKLQLRQTPAFPLTALGFVRHLGLGRRGPFTRHMTNLHANNGGADLSFYSVRTRPWSNDAGVSAGNPIVPVDEYLTIRMDKHDQYLAPMAIGGIHFACDKVAAKRVERRQLREAALDILAKVDTALAVTNFNDTARSAYLLQDMLDLTGYNPDYDFILEVEAASGREFYAQNEHSDYPAAVLIGAMYNGLRSDFRSDREGEAFIDAAKQLRATLNIREDKVFQADTLFSSTPYEPNGNALLAFTNNGQFNVTLI